MSDVSERAAVSVDDLANLALFVEDLGELLFAHGLVFIAGTKIGLADKEKGYPIGTLVQQEDGSFFIPWDDGLDNDD